MTNIEIIRADAGSEFYTEERCFIAETWSSDADPALSIALARLEPGVTTAWHWLDGVIERYRILAGRGRVEVGELPATVVRPGDVVVIPAGVRQRITNIGTEDLLFDCLCTPRFTPECYHTGV
jgi:mannose-6-phosphate isomerase-like protein (cupin superfamily)